MSERAQYTCASATPLHHVRLCRGAQDLDVPVYVLTHCGSTITVIAIAPIAIAIAPIAIAIAPIAIAIAPIAVAVAIAIASAITIVVAIAITVTNAVVTVAIAAAIAVALRMRVRSAFVVATQPLPRGLSASSHCCRPS
jgi:hypothetical protein